jgi:hypothetical protein
MAIDAVPFVGGDNDTWGEKLNAILGELDTSVTGLQTSVAAKLNTSDANATYAALAPTAPQIIERPVGITGPGDGYVTQFYRYAHYSGGTPGVVNSPLVGIVDVGPDVADFQWGILGIAYNRATGGQNVAGYFQGLRLTATTGETWGAVIQAVDQSGVGNPTVALTGLELDIGGNGTDVNLMRHGIGIYAQKDTTGPASLVVGHGIIFGGSGGTFTYGIAFGPSAVTATALAFQGTTDIGIDFSTGVTNTTQIKFKPSGWVDLGSDGVLRMKIPNHGTDNQLRFFDGGTNGLGLDITLGNIYSYNVKVLGQQRTGWTAATGTPTRTAFATGSVTLSALAEHVKALIDDLMTHGLIGT